MSNAKKMNLERNEEHNDLLSGGNRLTLAVILGSQTTYSVANEVAGSARCPVRSWMV